MRRKILLSVLACLVMGSTVRAEWTEPENGLYTEKQLTAYLEAASEMMRLYKDAGEAGKGASGMAGLAIAARTNKKFDEILARHKLTLDEFSWIGGKAWEAFGMVLYERMVAQTRQELDTHLKRQQQDLDQLERSLAEHRQALEKNQRVLTQEQQQRVVENAKSEAEDLKQEVADQEKRIKEQQEQVAAAETELANAEKTAANPPSDLTGEDREQFISEHREVATSARETLASERESLKEARQQLADLQKRQAFAEAQVKNPHLVPEEERASLREENTRQIEELEQQKKQLAKSIQVVKESQDEVMNSIAETMPKAPKENVQLIRKHLEQFAKIWDIDLNQVK